MIRYEIWGRSATFLLIIAAISLQFISGLGDDSLATKKWHKDRNTLQLERQDRSDSSFCSVGDRRAAVIGFFLFKYWQKKKREEQHARLLKLFEEDDELEVELGFRE